FFILTFVLAPIAYEFGVTIPAIALTISASLATRWIGAILFGLFADRYGRRIPLIVNILYYSLIEVLSGLAPSYKVFFFLRLLYGIGMGGEWGVGASLTMESVPARWRWSISFPTARRLCPPRSCNNNMDSAHIALRTSPPSP